MKQQALGLIETFGLVAAIEAADAALKAAAVELINYEKVKSGLITVALSGEVAAVQAAVAAGSAAAARLGKLVSQHVIPRPLANLDLLVEPRNRQKQESDKPEQSENNEKTKTDDSEELKYLQSLSVHELRRLARTIDGIAIKGRTISKANKEQLITEIIRARKLK